MKTRRWLLGLLLVACSWLPLAGILIFAHVHSNSEPAGPKAVEPLGIIGGRDVLDATPVTVDDAAQGRQYRLFRNADNKSERKVIRTNGSGDGDVTREIRIETPLGRRWVITPTDICEEFRPSEAGFWLARGTLGPWHGDTYYDLVEDGFPQWAALLDTNPTPAHLVSLALLVAGVVSLLVGVRLRARWPRVRR